MSMLLLAAGCNGFQLGLAPAQSIQVLLRAPFLRTSAPHCRENYVPSWVKAATNSSNIYAEQQNEYEEYEKYLKAREAGGSSQ